MRARASPASIARPRSTASRTTTSRPSRPVGHCSNSCRLPSSSTAASTPGDHAAAIQFGHFGFFRAHLAANFWPAAAEFLSAADRQARHRRHRNVLAAFASDEDVMADLRLRPVLTALCCGRGGACPDHRSPVERLQRAAALLRRAGAGFGAYSAPRVRVARNPYANVDWQHDLRLKTAMHDHVRTKPLYLKRMDDAGYDAVPLMHYSGVASLPHPWRERRWPPERFLPPELFAELKHIKLFYPSAEEVGLRSRHLALPDDVHREVGRGLLRAARTLALRIDAGGHRPDPRVRRHGLRGPSVGPGGRLYAKLKHFDGMEIYNAYWQAAAPRRQTHGRLQRGRCCAAGTACCAIGPRSSASGSTTGTAPGPIPILRSRPRRSDSGKVLVLAKSATLAGLREALQSGAVFAVKDLGARKDRYPEDPLRSGSMPA